MSHHDHEGKAPQVHAITSAAEAASLESKHRFRMYSLKMALRAVFFIAGAIIATTWNMWVGLAFLAASAVLPWLAVMGANLIVPQEGSSDVTYVDAPPADALGAGEDTMPDAGGSAGAQGTQEPEDAGGSGATAEDSAGPTDPPREAPDDEHLVIPGTFLEDGVILEDEPPTPSPGSDAGRAAGEERDA